MAMLGVPYGEAVQRAEEMARAQAAEIGAEIAKQGGPADLADKQIVALTAYLQRLGTDALKAPPAPQKDGPNIAGGPESEQHVTVQGAKP
jgi:cbb3-type cytochrome oxidase cytochrome c subunit